MPTTNFSLADLGINPGNTMTTLGSSLDTGSNWWNDYGTLAAGAGLSLLSTYAKTAIENEATSDAIAASDKLSNTQRQGNVQNMELAYQNDYYYNRLNKERKRKGLAAFRQNAKNTATYDSADD